MLAFGDETGALVAAEDAPMLAALRDEAAGRGEPVLAGAVVANLLLLGSRPRRKAGAGQNAAVRPLIPEEPQRRPGLMARTASWMEAR